LTANLPKGLSEVRINGKRIRQVLDNLINNAIKYSDEGTEVVVLAQLEKSELCISVRDQGWGIAPEELEEVFNRMYRARGKSAREENGMGLGLAICKGIVEAHGGRIWLESEEGKGTTCYFTIPLHTKGRQSHSEGA
jgi:two-component system sensor histidine kinase VicK